MATFTTSAKGQLKLVHNDFEYTKQRERNGVSYWMCVKRRWKLCRGKAQTCKIGSNYMVKIYDEHNHEH